MFTFSSFLFVDFFWFFVSFCFFASFLLHKFCSLHHDRCQRFGLFELFEDLIRYGKTKQKTREKKNERRKIDQLFKLPNVPKRWFWHFYAVSVCWNGFLLLLLTLNATFDLQFFPSWLTAAVDGLTGASSSHAHAHAPRFCTLLLQLLLFVHSLRRLLECLLVSVFSDGVMNLVQYLFGLGYYVVLGLTVLCSDRAGPEWEMHLNELNLVHLMGLLLFVGASKLQHQSIVLLAKLRTGPSGSVETLDHKMPNGGWFELVSCPHYFAELLIYVSLSLVGGGGSVTLWLVVLYVFFNQALAGQLCHELYLSRYEAYPKHRRAFIPFLM